MSADALRSSWVVGSMCHCGPDRDPDEPSEECDDHWDIWVAPASGAIGRLVIAQRIQFREEADHIVALHNAAIAVA